jgi:hypothetical protein
MRLSTDLTLHPPSTAWDCGKLPPSFVDDVLIAASCAESGVTLVTDNTRDFGRIGAVLRFGVAAPWPDGSGTAPT